ncbi:MAG: rRNA pseudouridine synthase [Clostridia bacterium]|nr:rRNA pseudouridine synthase [Clostridia bacterium]
MRLNKYLADCGVDSRRNCDEIIAQGRVKVNGKTITRLGVDVDPENDSVSLDGRRLRQKRRDVYVMLHKPKGVVCTAKDDKGRKTVLDLVDVKARLFPVGRLDYDTEGLLLLTTDGQLAQTLTHPSHHIPKTYVARIFGELSEEEEKSLEKGVLLDGALTQPASVKVVEKDDRTSRIEITIFEGRNRQVRRMLESVGKDVEFLKRVSVGELRLGGVSRGKYRFLTEKEINYLKSL